MLERERWPALARSATHEAGHAEGVEEEEVSAKKIRKSLKDNIKAELDSLMRQ
jgi:hypothetical protein